MRELLAVGAGGFVGAVLRWGISGALHRRLATPFPVGTLAVNVVGCLALGALAAAVEARGALAPSTRAFLAVGLLGALTTFSTFGHETVELVRAGRTPLAAASVLANVVLGIGAVLVGRALGQGLG